MSESQTRIFSYYVCASMTFLTGYVLTENSTMRSSTTLSNQEDAPPTNNPNRTNILYLVHGLLLFYLRESRV